MCWTWSRAAGTRWRCAASRPTAGTGGATWPPWRTPTRTASLCLVGTPAFPRTMPSGGLGVLWRPTARTSSAVYMRCETLACPAAWCVCNATPAAVAGTCCSCGRSWSAFCCSLAQPRQRDGRLCAGAGGPQMQALHIFHFASLTWEAVACAHGLPVWTFSHAVRHHDWLCAHPTLPQATPTHAAPQSLSRGSGLCKCPGRLARRFGSARGGSHAGRHPRSQ